MVGIDARPARAVDGDLLPGRVSRPGSADEAAQLLLDCTREGTPVHVVGAGTHQRVGAAMAGGAVTLSTAGLAGVLRYDPDDLVVSVGAGTILADVQATLRERGQRLPVDAPGGDVATIGGLLALALNGPRATGTPTLRDLLLGMSVAQTDGTVARSGGMVVKNVTGMDMGRLHVGARGTLGVIASANFKVLPIPETEATVSWTFRDAASATGIADRVRASSLRPAACDVTVDAGGAAVAVRFEGRAPGVERQVRDAVRLAPGATTLTGDESAAWWTRHVASLAMTGGTATVVRLEARPRDTGPALGRLATALATRGDAWRMASSPGVGLTWLHAGGDPAALPDMVRKAGLTATLATDGMSAWRSPGAAERPIDRALRKQFDPAMILNRGRFGQDD